MELIADILLASGAVGAAFYCAILGRRLKKFNSLEQGVGGAVAVLSAQVEDLRQTLASAQKTAEISAETLSDMTLRAEDMAKRLELQMAAMHDIPETPAEPASAPVAAPAVDPTPPSEPMFMRRASGDI